MRAPTTTKTIETYEYPVEKYGVLRVTYHGKALAEVMFDPIVKDTDPNILNLKLYDEAWIKGLTAALTEATNDREEKKRAEVSQNQVQQPGSDGSESRNPSV